MKKQIIKILTTSAVASASLFTSTIRADYDDKPFINNYDIYDEIAPDSTLTIKWDRVDNADYYFYKAKVLASTPSHNTNETAYGYGNEYVVSGETAKRRCKIDSDILVPGQYIKIYIEAHAEDGSYISNDYTYLYVSDIAYANTPDSIFYDSSKGLADINSAFCPSNNPILPDGVLVNENVETTADGKHIYKNKNMSRLSLVEPRFWLEAGRNVESTSSVETLKLLIDQFDVLNKYDSSDKSFGDGFYFPSGGSTYCTTFAHDVANAFGAAIPEYCCSECGLAKNIGFSKDLSDYLIEKGSLCECGGKISSLLAFKVSKRQNAINDLYKFMESKHDIYGWEEIPDDDKVNTAIEESNAGNLVIGLYSDYKKEAGHIFIVYPTPDGEKMHQVQAGGKNAMSDGSLELNRNYHRDPSNSWITYYVFRGID